MSEYSPSPLWKNIHAKLELNREADWRHNLLAGIAAIFGAAGMEMPASAKVTESNAPALQQVMNSNDDDATKAEKMSGILSRASEAFDELDNMEMPEAKEAPRAPRAPAPKPAPRAPKSTPAHRVEFSQVQMTPEQIAEAYQMDVPEDARIKNKSLREQHRRNMQIQEWLKQHKEKS